MENDVYKSFDKLIFQVEGKEETVGDNEVATNHFSAKELQERVIRRDLM